MGNAIRASRSTFLPFLLSNSITLVAFFFCDPWKEIIPMEIKIFTNQKEKQCTHTNMYACVCVVPVKI